MRLGKNIQTQILYFILYNVVINALKTHLTTLLTENLRHMYVQFLYSMQLRKKLKK